MEELISPAVRPAKFAEGVPEDRLFGPNQLFSAAGFASS